MPKNRKAATDVCVKLMSDLYPGTENAELTRRYLDGMTNAEFDAYITELREKRSVVTATVPNFDPKKFDEEHFLKFGKKHGVEFFHRLKVTDPDTGRVFTTPHRYMVIRDRVNRLQQMLEDKTSFPMDNSHVDELSGQVTNESKGARLSFPEINNLNAKGFRAFVAETIGVRGGNQKALRLFEAQLRSTGTASAAMALDASDGSKATHTLAAYLRAMGFGTTLDRR
ncbi:hypothetical protein DQR70_06435 [Salmonella enterica subsp. enterica serovar Oslo]|nr:hypothetical protein [Salmonella enterica subsp. enterica serovar Oslo]ELF5187154.1 hypothetical protein [Salmonella enterica]